MNKKQWTIIGHLGTIDYMGNDKYIAHLETSLSTHVFTTKDLPTWLKNIEASADAYKGITTSEWTG